MWSLSLPRHRRLSRYWNALAAGQPPAELSRLAASVEPTRLQAIDQLAALDDARVPDPFFVARLERGLMRAATLNPRTLTLLPPTTSVPGNGRYGVPGARPALPSPPSRARRWAGSQLATAVFLVAVLATSF